MAQNWEQKGEVITFVESEMTHPDPGDGLINSEQPFVVGELSGVAQIDAAATTSEVPGAVTGVWNLECVGKNDAGNVAIAKGDKIYYDPAVPELNKDNVNGSPFGIALGAVTSGATATIPVLLARF